MERSLGTRRSRHLGVGGRSDCCQLPEGTLVLEPEGQGAPAHLCPIHPAPPSSHPACPETSCQELASAVRGLASSRPPERRPSPLVHSGLIWSVSTWPSSEQRASGDLLKGGMCIRSGGSVSGTNASFSRRCAITCPGPWRAELWVLLAGHVLVPKAGCQGLAAIPSLESRSWRHPQASVTQ